METGLLFYHLCPRTSWSCLGSAVAYSCNSEHWHELCLPPYQSICPPSLNSGPHDQTSTWRSCEDCALLKSREPHRTQFKQSRHRRRYAFHRVHQQEVYYWTRIRNYSTRSLGLDGAQTLNSPRMAVAMSYHGLDELWGQGWVDLSSWRETFRLSGF